MSAGGGASSDTHSAGPVTIDILTRAGVTAPTGHSQWYAKAAQTTFTPRPTSPST
jgi:hypothetical protein